MSTPQPRPSEPDPAHDAPDPELAKRLELLGLEHQEVQWIERYLVCQHLADPALATCRQQFEATSRFIRDLVAHRWVSTRQAREQAAAKRIHYMSMEFLLGRTLRNNMMNLAAEPLVRRVLEQQGWRLECYCTRQHHRRSLLRSLADRDQRERAATRHRCDRGRE